MTLRILSLVTLTIVMLFATQVLAHDEYRIIGTVTAFQNSQLQVKNREGKTFTIKVNTETYIHRDKEKPKVAASELKVGRSVVVDALGDSEADLVAAEVRLVPTIAPASKK
jgi:hypothetical protein